MITTHVGVSGAGKTYAMREDINATVRSGERIVAVYDRMREWNTVPESIVKVTRKVEGVAEVQKLADRGARLIIVQPPPIREVDQHVTNAVMLAEWCLKESGRGICLPEGHRIIPNKSNLPPAVDEIITAWRHYDVAMWVDSQRMALLNATVRAQSTKLRLFAIRGHRDYQVIKEMADDNLVSLMEELYTRSDFDKTTGKPRNPGLYVEAANGPPYTIDREGTPPDRHIINGSKEKSTLDDTGSNSKSAGEEPEDD